MFSNYCSLMKVKTLEIKKNIKVVLQVSFNINDIYIFQFFQKN